MCQICIPPLATGITAGNDAQSEEYPSGTVLLHVLFPHEIHEPKCNGSVTFELTDDGS
jgi:hypothetical protein